MNANATAEKRVAIVTGASTGLGLHGYRLQHGHRVVAAQHQQKALGLPMFQHPVHPPLSNTC